LTEKARQVVILAQEEARILEHHYIDTEHILLGLFRVEEGLAAQVLESLDITAERVRAQIVRTVGSGEHLASGYIPFTPPAQRVRELAMREALSLGHDYIDTEHILLWLARADGGVAASILRRLKVDEEDIRGEVIRMLPASDEWLELPGEAETPPPGAIVNDDRRREALRRGNEVRLTRARLRRELETWPPG
jgi:ATP-dependent Clp protease ATP-binding subunit ClpC